MCVTEYLCVLLSDDNDDHMCSDKGSPPIQSLQ